MQGFGNNHAKKATRTAIADTPIESATANFPLSLNPELLSLSPLPLARVVGEEFGAPETVCAVVVEGEWASDEGFVVVVKEGGVSRALCAVAVEEDGVSVIAKTTPIFEGVTVTEISKCSIDEERRMLGTIDKFVVV